ncbi:serine hydrolase [Mucisphaera calidilacus]|uniref:D-alanyl-D-alanine-carboxypeptidase/endopeptidase AmpH n=1 Tax=Mucisphaera calidilacus TaxID=2527982 RepID=A0A518BVV3_9BACT|nr:serine hydrolase [Mucisphaera calidilacus]QDU71113.1 D-alanyl-D-alanine-carboxypeptidase/endopeptidase AmpH precursor [Mucisphaera calidilacus]
MKTSTTALAAALCLCPLSADANTLPTLTNLAQGALAGLNVAGNQDVPGFEIKVLRHGRTLYHQAFGDWEQGQIAAADSSTKTMSGALIMSVTQYSVLPFSLDTTLADLLPAFDTPDKREITIRQAFSHTSGLPAQGASSPILANPDITLQQAAAQIADLPLIAEPGTAFAYGGLSMHAAGAAAEIAAGVEFNELFARRITRPMDLDNTTFARSSETNPRVAGGIDTTADDFTRFMDMLLNNGIDRPSGARILSPQSVDAMLTRVTTDDTPIASSPVDNNRYGIGTWLDQLNHASPGVDALAAGARGFHSWIDESQGLVFTLATDTTRFSSIETLSAHMHAAILTDLSGNLVGDIDQDGQIDARDIDLLSTAIQTGSTGTIFDLNGSGTVDRLDLDFLITGILGTAPGDANLDGTVDLLDLSSLAENFNQFGRGWAEGNFNANGFTGLGDLSILATHFDFGATPTLVAAPEPAATLTGLIALTLVARRSRGSLSLPANR